jgi:outer membrane protein assembly factor BamB
MKMRIGRAGRAAAFLVVFVVVFGRVRVHEYEHAHEYEHEHKYETVGLLATAYAEPVPIGRYVEIPLGVSQRSPYAMSGSDARRTGRSHARAPAQAPSRLWSVVLPQRELVPPAVLEDGTLIVGSAGGVHAIDPASGEQRWYAPIGALRYTPSLTPNGELAAIAGGKLVLVGEHGESREVELPARATGAPLVLDSGTIVVLGRDAQAHVVGADGAYVTSVPISLPSPGAQWMASVGGDRVVASGPGQELTLLSLQAGDERSLHLTARAAGAPLIGDDETIWVVGDRGTLWALAADGRARTSAELGQAGARMPAALGWDGALRVGLPYGEVVCVGASGDERWRRGIDSPPGALLLDADDTALLVSARGTLYAIDRAGELRWRQTLGLRNTGRPVLAQDGVLIVVARSGVIQAWR